MATSSPHTAPWCPVCEAKHEQGTTGPIGAHRCPGGQGWCSTCQYACARTAGAAVDVTAATPADAFGLARALHCDPVVRAELARRGMAAGAPIIVTGDPARVAAVAPEARFRAWRDPAVPGGWTGEPIGGRCRKCGNSLAPCAACGKPSLCGDAWCAEHIPNDDS